MRPVGRNVSRVLGAPRERQSGRTLSISFGALLGLLFGLGSPGTLPAGAYRCPKLLEYRLPCVLGDPPERGPVGLPEVHSVEDERPEPRLDGTKGGEGRNGVTGDEGKAVGDGGTRDEVGD